MFERMYSFREVHGFEDDEIADERKRRQQKIIGAYVSFFLFTMLAFSLLVVKKLFRSI